MFGPHLGSFRNCMKLGAKQDELVQLMQMFVPCNHIGITRNNAPDPTHWTLNSCFVTFHSVWVHLELFLYWKKLAAKRVELVQLMQKFVPQSLVWNFRNERTRYTPLDPKHMFLFVSYQLGALAIISLLHESWSRMGQYSAINANGLSMKSCWCYSQRT